MELALLEELTTRAGPAIENARRFGEARQLADLDALTGLHNRRYFHETLARECSRAHRYDRKLALVVVDIDDFKSINDRIGHLSGDAVLAAVAERIQSVVRSADVACRVGGDEFAVILPESSMADAEQLYRRIQFAVGSRPLGPFERIRRSAGLAELQPRTTPRRSSSAPTRLSTAPRSPARVVSAQQTTPSSWPLDGEPARGF
jgi:diguanylate cyclase (GGDEF)-like protein